MRCAYRIIIGITIEKENKYAFFVLFSDTIMNGDLATYK